MRSTALGALAKSQKKTPPKAGFLGFSLGVLPCFHSVKKPSSQMNLGSEIPLSKSRRISWLTDLRNLLSMCLANSSQGLAPHTPKEGFVAFFFLCLVTQARSGDMPSLLYKPSLDPLESVT